MSKDPFSSDNERTRKFLELAKAYYLANRDKANETLAKLPIGKAAYMAKGSIQDLGSIISAGKKALSAGQKATAGIAEDTPAGIATEVGKLGMYSLKELSKLARSSLVLGSKRLTGDKKTTLKELLAKTTMASEAINALPSEANINLPNVGPVPSSVVNKTVIQSSPLISAVRGLNLKVPTKIIPTEPTKLSDNTNKILFLINRMYPQNRIGSSLGNLMYKKLTAGQPTSPTGIPQIVEKKTLGDLTAKPLAGLASDVYTDPFTFIGGGANLALKGIKSAIGSSYLPYAQKWATSKRAKETFEAFGEGYPKAMAILAKIFSFGKVDEGALYGAMRTPSKLLSPDFVKTVNKFKNEVVLFTQKALRKGNRWYDIKDPAIQEEIGKAVYSNDFDALRKYVSELVESGSKSVKKFDNPIEDIVKIAQDFRRLQTIAGQSAVKSGLITPEVFEANKRNYVRTFYRYFEDNPQFLKESPESGLRPLLETSPVVGQNKKIDIKLFKKKLKPEDFATPELYKEFQKTYGVLGPENIGYSATKGAILTTQAAKTKQMFQEISEIPNMAKTRLPEDMLAKVVPGANLAEKESIVEAGAKRIKVGDFGTTPLLEINGVEHIKIPANQAYGALAGKWMPRYEGMEIVNVFKRKNEYVQLMDNAIGIWKTLKVPYSTTAQSRNFFISNPILMMMSGINPADAITLGPKAMTKFIDKGFATEVGRNYLRLGGLGRTYVDKEAIRLVQQPTIKKTSAAAQKLSDALTGTKKAASVPGKLYSNLEHAGKMGIMEYWHGKGLSWEEAFKRAQSALFDYGDRSALIDKLSRFVIPFATFPSKALPFAAKTALSRPKGVMTAIAMRDVWNEREGNKLGLTDKEINLIKKRYGEWYLIAGGEKGKPNIIDLSYLTPGADLYGSSEGRGLLPEGVPQTFQPSHPALAGFEIGFDKSLYFDKPITNESMIETKDVGKYANALIQTGVNPVKAWTITLSQTKDAAKWLHLWRVLGPANAWVPGTYQNNVLISALSGVPTYSGRTISPEQALLQEFGGIKLNQMDLKTSKGVELSKKTSEAGEIYKKLLSIKNKNIPNKEEVKRLLKDMYKNKYREMKE